MQPFRRVTVLSVHCGGAFVGIASTYNEIRPKTLAKRRRTRPACSYEECRAKEHNASSRLLHSDRKLAHEEYMQLLAELRVMRTECDQKVLAVKAYHSERLDQLIGAAHNA